METQGVLVRTSAEAIDWLRANGSAEVRDQMGPRYGIHTPHAFGIPMKQLKLLGKQLGRDHELADELWASGWYEARIVASLIDDPSAVTPLQMDEWAAAFDNWAICDTVCFNLFDQTPHAWVKVDLWASATEEFVKRAAFALLWSLALHDKRSPDSSFVHGLALIEREASDERPLIGKSISMALRAIAHRGDGLAAEVAETAARLAASDNPRARAIGKLRLRESAHRVG